MDLPSFYFQERSYMYRIGLYTIFFFLYFVPGCQWYGVKQADLIWIGVGDKFAIEFLYVILVT